MVSGVASLEKKVGVRDRNDERGVQLQPIGNAKMVPLSIPPALENREYMRWLTEEEAEGKEKHWTLIRNKHDGSHDMRHQYYHYIQSYFLEW